MKKAIFCGTFDPFTLGHLDILKKAGKIFDKVYVALPIDTEKSTKSTAEKRIKIAKASIEGLEFAEVISFSGLLSDFCKAVNVFDLVRGLRNSTDFVYEKDLLAAYKSQCSDLECTYFITDSRFGFISSTFVRELAILDGNIEDLVAKNAISLVLQTYALG